jgi:SAM-dependent methyltransferase
MIHASKRFTRFALYRAMQNFFAGYELTGKKVLAVSGYPEFLPECDCIVTKYPAEDLTRLSYPDGSFDLVVSDFVLEHVLDPFAAMREKHRVLKAGGIAITTTNGLYAYHGEGNHGDYWRFQTDGMQVLTRMFSHSIIDFAGNGEMVKMLIECGGRAWEGNLSVDNPDVLAKVGHKDPRWQMTVWAISTK